MNPTQRTKPPAPKSNLKWLLIVLGIVILAAGGIYYFYVLKPSSGTPTTSPTAVPTRSTSITPSSSLTASPSAKTSLTSPTASALVATATPSSATSPTPPAGWKKVTNIAVGAGSANAQFSIYIKNDWTEYNESDTAHGPVFYTSNDSCGSNLSFGPGTGYQNCWDQVAVSYYNLSNYTGASNMTIRQFSSPNGVGSINVGVNKSLSTSDQNIIFNSVKVLSYL